MKPVFGIALSACAILMIPPVQAATSIAAARIADGYTYFWCTDKSNVAEAKSCALASCHDGAAADGASAKKCKTVDSSPHRSWWAIFHRKDGGISYAYADSRQKAIDDAYVICKKSGAQCPEEAAEVFSDGPLDEGAKPPPPQATSAPPVERWTTRCVNSRCVRNYEDGRQQFFTACINSTTGFAFDNLSGSCAGVDMTGHIFGQ
jgi:hypothetical protein